MDRGGCSALAEDLQINSPNSLMSRNLRHLSEDGKWYRKALLFITVLFLIVGLCVVSQGTYYRFSNREGDKILVAVPTLQTVMKFAPNVLTAYGVFLFLLGFAVLFAAFRPADIVLGSFCAAAVVFLVTALLIAVLGCSMHSDIDDEASREFKGFWEFSRPPGYESRTQLQVLFKCCGFNDPTDQPGPAGCDPGIKEVGCKKKIMQYYTAEANKSGVIMLLMSVIDILGIVLGLRLLKNLDQAKYNALQNPETAQQTKATNPPLQPPPTDRRPGYGAVAMDPRHPAPLETRHGDVPPPHQQPYPSAGLTQKMLAEVERMVRDDPSMSRGEAIKLLVGGCLSEDRYRAAQHVPQHPLPSPGHGGDSHPTYAGPYASSQQ